MWGNRRLLAILLIAILTAAILALAAAQDRENPFRQPGDRVHAENLIKTFKIQRLSYISQDILQDLTLFFTNSQLAAIWDACEEAGGSVTSWDQLKDRKGIGETTLWKLYVFFDLEGSITEEEE